LTHENDVLPANEPKPGAVQATGRRARRFSGTSLVALPTDPWFIKLKKARLRARLSQRDLAAIMEISHVAISLWERGLSFPRESKYEVLESVLAQKIFEVATPVFSPAPSPPNIELLKIYNALDGTGREDLIHFAREILGRQSRGLVD
jgi:transcriptional regulator with XRE-family HTH domain